MTTASPQRRTNSTPSHRASLAPSSIRLLRLAVAVTPFASPPFDAVRRRRRCGRTHFISGDRTRVGERTHTNTQQVCTASKKPRARAKRTAASTTTMTTTGIALRIAFHVHYTHAHTHTHTGGWHAFVLYTCAYVCVRLFACECAKRGAS